jgi:hypothetical protein
MPAMTASEVWEVIVHELDAAAYCSVSPKKLSVVVDPKDPEAVSVTLPKESTGVTLKKQGTRITTRHHLPDASESITYWQIKGDWIESESLPQTMYPPKEFVETIVLDPLQG